MGARIDAVHDAVALNHDSRVFNCAGKRPDEGAATFIS